MIFAILRDNGFIYCAYKFDLISDNQEVIGICNMLSIFGLLSTGLYIFLRVLSSDIKDIVDTVWLAPSLVPEHFCHPNQNLCAH